MTPTPKRRWSYSLRTLFVVVTLVAIGTGWIGRNVYLMRLRPKLMYSFYKRGAGNEAGFSHKRELPWLWSASGMRHFGADFELPSDEFTEADRRQLQAVFPEVDVVLVDRRPREVPDERLLSN